MLRSLTPASPSAGLGLVYRFGIRGVTKLPLHTLGEHSSPRGPHPRQLPVPWTPRLWPMNCAAKPVLEAGTPKARQSHRYAVPQCGLGQPGTGRTDPDVPGQHDPVHRGFKAGAYLHGPRPHDQRHRGLASRLKAAVFGRSDIQRRDTICCHGVGGRVSGGRREAQSPRSPRP